MGMDIYFQAETKAGEPVGERINIRCRDLYHFFNDWLTAQGRDTPESGEEVLITSEQWKAIAPDVVKTLANADQSLLGVSPDEAVQLATALAEEIFPKPAEQTRYWFTV